jgi:hypothetical protein
LLVLTRVRSVKWSELRSREREEVSEMKGFIIGALAGAVAMYIWRDEIGHYLDSRTSGLRTRAADTLKQAGDLMESASGAIGDTLAAGQEAIRPAHVREVSANR